MMDDREERIRQRAFDLWQDEGSMDGCSLSHWLQAEKEIEDEDAAREGGDGGEKDVPSATGL